MNASNVTCDKNIRYGDNNLIQKAICCTLQTTKRPRLDKLIILDALSALTQCHVLDYWHWSAYLHCILWYVCIYILYCTVYTTWCQNNYIVHHTTKQPTYYLHILWRLLNMDFHHTKPSFHFFLAQNECKSRKVTPK